MTNDDKSGKKRGTEECFPSKIFKMVTMIEPSEKDNEGKSTKFSWSERQFRLFVFQRKTSKYAVSVVDSTWIPFRTNLVLTKGACLARLRITSATGFDEQIVVAGTHMKNGGAKDQKDRVGAINESQKVMEKQKSDLESIINAAQKLCDHKTLPLFISGDINNRQIELPIQEYETDKSIHDGILSGDLIVRAKSFLKKDYKDWKGKNRSSFKPRLLASKLNACRKRGIPKEIQEWKTKVLAADSFRYHKHWMTQYASERNLEMVEPTIDFLPTYKLKKNGKRYKEPKEKILSKDDQSIPSYCDRHFAILPTSSGWEFEPGSYRSLPHITNSDHFPVVASVVFTQN